MVIAAVLALASCHAVKVLDEADGLAMVGAPADLKPIVCLHDGAKLAIAVLAAGGANCDKSHSLILRLGFPPAGSLDQHRI